MAIQRDFTVGLQKRRPVVSTLGHHNFKKTLDPLFGRRFWGTKSPQNKFKKRTLKIQRSSLAILQLFFAFIAHMGRLFPKGKLINSSIGLEMWNIFETYGDAKSKTKTSCNM